MRKDAKSAGMRRGGPPSLGNDMIDESVTRTGGEIGETLTGFNIAKAGRC